MRLLAALLILWPALALAQGTVQQSGPVGAQHLAMYIGNGRVVDAGGPPGRAQPPANQANPGTLPTGLGVVNNNLGFANFSGYSGNPYSEFLWGMDYLGTGDGLIKLDRVGGGGPLTLWCEINHVRFECFNGSGGGTVTSILAEHGLYATPTNPITHSGNIGCDTISASVRGCGKVDGTTITADGNGVISATAGGAVGANPTATASNVAVNGAATTYMRSDAAPAVQLISGAQFGIAKVDGTSITASGGVISALGGVPVTVDVFSTPGLQSWTKQPGVTIVCFVAYGSGGAGGSGAGGSSGIGTGRSGGSGGGGGARREGCYSADELSATEAIGVGTGGSASAGGTNANGTDGIEGTPSWFKVSTNAAYAGGGGAGGLAPIIALYGAGGGGLASNGSAGGTSPSTGGLPSSVAGKDGISNGGAGSDVYNGSSAENGGSSGGGTAISGFGYAGGGTFRGGRAGGAGGGVNDSDVAALGNHGGGRGWGPNAPGGGVAGPASGDPGSAGDPGSLYEGGFGGGGGAGSNSGPGGAGAAGGLCGGGGGAGAGGTDTGGAGGRGGAGCVFVYQW